MLDMGGGILGEPFPLPHVGAKCGDLCFWPETAAEQAIRVQLAQPSRIADIRFASWHILGIASVYEDDLEARRFTYIESRYPVNAGRLHRHAGNAAWAFRAAMASWHLRVS